MCSCYNDRDKNGDRDKDGHKDRHNQGMGIRIWIRIATYEGRDRDMESYMN